MVRSTYGEYFRAVLDPGVEAVAAESEEWATGAHRATARGTAPFQRLGRGRRANRSESRSERNKVCNLAQSSTRAQSSPIQRAFPWLGGIALAGLGAGLGGASNPALV